MSQAFDDTDLDGLPLLDVVLWSYRLFLQRNPENLDSITRHIAAGATLSNIRQKFIQSDEFQAQIRNSSRSVLADEFLQLFPPYKGPGTDGFLTDFIGTRTRCSYLPSVYAGASGIVEGPPGTEHYGLHELAEWEGTLRSVMEAKGSFVAVELGAGWGPWLVAGAKAAKRLGISEVRLAGVEGASSHYQFMLQHLRDNGIDPAFQLLIHAVAGSQDGIARFPKLDDPSGNWGAQASYGEAATTEQFEEVPSISVATLLSKLPPVDLLHCDVQGAEGDVLTAAPDALSARVRRIVVGTHGREIEGRLMEFFGANGWILEHETSCRFIQGETGTLHLVADGVQVWRNTGFRSAA